MVPRSPVIPDRAAVNASWLLKLRWAQVAGQAATKLASDENVVGVVGTLNSSTSQTVQPILKQEGIVQVSPANTGPALVVALNYGSQDEIARAAAKAAAKGAVSVQSIEAELDTAGLPPLDLLIRTSGEVRLSNFLLWQAAYAEIHMTDCLWPDFGPAQLREALADFAQRERRFGGL